MRIPIGTSVLAGALTATLLVACWAGIGSGLTGTVGEDFLRPDSGSAAPKDGGDGAATRSGNSPAGDGGRAVTTDADGAGRLTLREAGTAADPARDPAVPAGSGGVGPPAEAPAGDLPDGASAVLDDAREAGSILDSPAGVLGP